MNVRDLTEAEGIANFSDLHDRASQQIQSLARNAFGKLKNKYDTAKGEISAQQKKDAKQAELDKEKREKEEAKNKKDVLSAKAGSKSAPTTVASIVLDRTPEEGDLPELEDLDAEHFANVQSAVDQVQQRFDKFSKNLIKIMRTAQFINAADRKEVPERLGDQDDKIVERAETMLMQNKYGEHDAWMQALTNDEAEVGAKALLQVLAKISAQHSKLNLAQAKKVYADGLNLINVIGAQRQVIGIRLGLMRNAVAALSQKSQVSEQLFERLGRLSKKMNPK